MNSILITGCNRGLGLGLVKQLLVASKPTKYIFATCRNPDKAQELNELKTKHDNLHIFPLDVTNYESFDALVNQIDEIVKDEGLNVLLNNAGISPKSTRLNATKDSDLRDTFETNSVAPIMLTKAFIPLLKKASKFNESQPLGVKCATIVNMSSILGSIQENVQGGMYAYRMSKVALNMATKSMSHDLKKDRILCVAMHPGWVRTDLGGKNAPLDIETSCKSMLQTIQALDESKNGAFVQFDGKSLPW